MEPGVFPPPPDPRDDGWLATGIPLELLHKILRNLVENKKVLRSTKRSLLRARLVHPRWNEAMSTILEDECLQTWRKLELSPHSACEADHPLNLSNILVHRSQRGDLVDTLFCPPELLELGAKVNPFPTKSLKLSYPKGISRHWNKYAVSMNVGLFFIKFGHHLTSLVLSNLTLTPDILQRILKATPHLIALTFSTVNIHVTSSEAQEDDEPVYNFPELPSLPLLRHFRQCWIAGEDLENECIVNIRDWLLGPYQQQLETFDTDSYSDYQEDENLRVQILGNDTTNFAKLKRLTTWDSDIFRFHTVPEKCPQLECLSLVAYKDYYEDGDRDDTLEYLQFVLAPLADRLTQLNLCIFIRPSVWNSYWVAERMNKSAGIGLEDNNSETYKFTEFQWLSAGVRFSKLKILSIPVSMFQEEEEAVRNMLKCFPILEIIHFMIEHDDRVEKWGGNAPMEHEISNARELVRKVAAWDWKGCQKLKKITLREGLSRKTGFIEEHLIQ